MKKRPLKRTFSRSKGAIVKRSTRETCLDTAHPLFPACDGQPWHEDQRADATGEIKRQFLQAYLRINLAYARLVAFRKQRPSASPRARERDILQQIERALVALEALEDRYASRGGVATPTYRHGFTINVSFSDVRTALAQRGPRPASSSSVRLAIPLPAGLRAKR